MIENSLDQWTEVIPLAQELLACPSLTPNDAGCQKIIRERLQAMKFHCESLRFDDVDNLWARIGTDSPLFVFAGHTDVVPTGPESEWKSSPFSPVIRDNYLYARGAADMKSAIAAMIIATEVFLKTNKKFQGSIGFLFTSDEEGPAINGTRKVIETLEKRREKIDYCVIGESSSDKYPGDQIRIGRRGSLHCKLIVRGKQGHVAYPQLADNPVHKVLLALHELTTTIWDKGNEDYPPTSFQISNIHAGTGATNVIPGNVEIQCNFRYSTAVSVKELQERMKAVLDKQGLKYEMQWDESAQPFLTKKGKLISVTEQAIMEITGIQTISSTAGGTSDGRFIAPTGAEVVELGLVNATAHQINECVKTEDIVTLAQIYHAILMRVFTSY